MGVDLLFVEQSPIPVTKTEKKPYAFDFTDLLAQGETVTSTHEHKLTQIGAGTDVTAQAITSAPAVASPTITVTVDWSVAAVLAGRNYRLRVTALIGTRREALMCDFNVHQDGV